MAGSTGNMDLISGRDKIDSSVSVTVTTVVVHYECVLVSGHCHGCLVMLCPPKGNGKQYLIIIITILIK